MSHVDISAARGQRNRHAAVRIRELPGERVQGGGDIGGEEFIECRAGVPLERVFQLIGDEHAQKAAEEGQLALSKLDQGGAGTVWWQWEEGRAVCGGEKLDNEEFNGTGGLVDVKLQEHGAGSETCQ